MKKLVSVVALAVLCWGGVFISCSDSDSDDKDPVLKSIEVASSSTQKTVFSVGDEFSSEGLVLNAKWSNGTKTVTEGFTTTLAEANLSDGKVIRSTGSAGHSESAKVTVNYENKETTYNVTVTDVVSKITVTVDSEKVKTEYTIGEKLDTTGITVKAFYSDDDTEGEDVTETATITATIKDGENDVAFTTATAGSYEVTIAAEYAGQTDAASDVEIVVNKASPNLITAVTFKSAYLAPNWSAILNNVTDIKETNGKVVIEGTNVSYTLVSGLVAQWQAQLLVGTNVSISKNDYWFFSCKLSGVTGGYTIKLNNDESLISEQKGTVAEGGTTILIGGKSSVDISDMPIMFDFGTCSEGTVKISDLCFEIVDIDSVTVESLSITPKTSEVYEGKAVEFTALVNDLYPVDVTYTTSETGVSASTVDGNKVTTGSVSGTENGTVTVAATYKGVEGTATITVKKVEAVTDKDIISLITEINPSWGQAGSCEKVTLTEAVGDYTGEVAKFTNLNYQGWNITGFDASLYKGICVEYYTEDLATLSIFPINTTLAAGSQEYEITNTSITKNAWTKAKYAFAEGKDAIQANVNQLKFVGTTGEENKNGNLYIKAIYFYAEEDE